MLWFVLLGNTGVCSLLGLAAWEKEFHARYCVYLRRRKWARSNLRGPLPLRQEGDFDRFHEVTRETAGRLTM